jgi:hypothetical protein
LELTFDIFSGIGAAHRDVAAGLSVSMLRGGTDSSESYLVSFLFVITSANEQTPVTYRTPIRGSRDRRVS